MFCQNCGKEIEKGSMYCPSCGYSTGGGDRPNYQGGNAYNPYPTPLKSNGWAIVLAVIMLGLGHLYAGKIGAGLILFFSGLALNLSAVFLIITGLNYYDTYYYDSYDAMWFLAALIPLIIYFIMWIWNIYAANKLVNEYNNAVRKTGNPPW